MSWNQQPYSFGNPNAQPPTPTQTPTSADFSSPTFQTPRTNNINSELHSGWTPKFAEEYSVFNTTPGRLTSSNYSSFVETTPRPSTASSSRRNLSTTEELAQDIASHVNHTVQTTLPLPPVDPSRRLSSSPGHVISPGQPGYQETQGSHTAPKKPRRQLEEAFSGQTATPPQSAVKPTRRLAPRAETLTMQRDDENLHIFGTPGQQSMLDFSNMPDMFSFPMSAPATAPAFTQTKNFWDPDANMGGMSMDFSGPEGTFFDGSPHKLGNSFDWGRSNQMFQEASSNPHFNTETSQHTSAKRPRALAARPPHLDSSLTENNYDFGGPIPDDPFAIAASTGAVNPGLLFTIPPELNALHISVPDQSGSSQSRPQTGQSFYQSQQLRSSFQDQDPLRRSQSSKDLGSSMSSKKAFVTPHKLRPGLQRSASEGRARKPISQKPTHSSNTSQRLPKGRQSPVKQLSRPNLASIPETTSSRASVSFTIDENGRAHTITNATTIEPRTAKGGPVASDDESSYVESSSDDEPIIVPSRNSSFVLPNSSRPSLSMSSQKRRSVESMSAVRRSSSALGGCTSSASSYKGSNSPGPSEADTMIDDSDHGRGDAQAELRRVQQERRSSLGIASRGGNTVRRQLVNDRSGRARPRSPSEMTDLIDMATPDTGIRSDASVGSTRCICHQREGDTFMVQCESCEKWVHGSCVNINRFNLPSVYICAFCAQTPNMRNGRIRDPIRTRPSAAQAFGELQHDGTGQIIDRSSLTGPYIDRSPLARKSFGRGGLR